MEEKHLLLNRGLSSVGRAPGFARRTWIKPALALVSLGILGACGGGGASGGACQSCNDKTNAPVFATVGQLRAKFWKNSAG